MRTITIHAQNSATLLDDKEGLTYQLSTDRGVLDLPAVVNGTERYLVFRAEALTEHSAVLELCFYTRNADKCDMRLKFGLLPHFEAQICIDMQWLDAAELFLERQPGALKMVCLGGRVDRSDLTRVSLVSAKCFQDVTLRIRDIWMTDEKPDACVLQDTKLVDIFGQDKRKNWPEKIDSVETLRTRLAALPGTSEILPDWTDDFGGCRNLRLGPGTGFFTKARHDGRWYLVDPEGYAFISLGVDCVGVRADSRVDGVETLCDWLPEADSPLYGMYNKGKASWEHGRRMYSFEQANLYRAYGEDWYAKWQTLMPRMLRNAGMNTIGNWSDADLCKAARMPYVTQLPAFPDTEAHIFRDFPDVLSDEYAASALACAEALRPTLDDPFLIGYFLRNEPGWAFVDDLILADEVLFCPLRTSCKAGLIAFLTEQYGNIGGLNNAWGIHLDSFDALYDLHTALSAPNTNMEAPVIRKVSAYSPQAMADMRAFSKILLRAYVEIPTRACRAVDPNHMVLGMRWAWVSHADLVTGWELFDVFSINCYSTDPVPAMDRVVGFGVDLPILIGEFHFGALDGGPTATGLLGVRTQTDRGKAYRHYVERAAAHPYGVGCHYFQCYDQFALGRFDGENYNIGILDICSQPYPALMAAMLETGRAVYAVAQKHQEPCPQTAAFIPLIAF